MNLFNAEYSTAACLLPSQMPPSKPVHPHIQFFRHAVCDAVFYMKRSYILRSISRLTAFSFRSCRLSYKCFPRQTPTSSLTFPHFRYIRSGMSVYPFCAVSPRSFVISFLWRSSLRTRSGSRLKIFPFSYGLMCILFTNASAFLSLIHI